MKRLLLTLALLWPVGAVADFQAGVEAAQRGDFATAMREWLPLAQQGNARAQFSLGMLHAGGHGVPQDNAAAVKWYRIAAQQGIDQEKLSIGIMYSKDEGVPEDHVQAYAWFNLSAAQGFMDAAEGKTIIQKRMTHTQIAEAQKLSRELCAKIPNCAK